MNVTNITSPLTVIALFAAIVEASALASLPFLSEDSQGVYTWFLVGFPPFLTVLFFITLNFNSRALFSPPDADTPEDSHSGSAHSLQQERQESPEPESEHVVILIGDQRFCELTERELTAPLLQLKDRYALQSRIIAWDRRAAGNQLISSISQPPSF